MKKLTVILTAAALATALGGTAALAAGGVKQNHGGSGNQTPSVSSCSYCTDASHCYTDADGDGICDYSPRQNSTAPAADTSCGYGTGCHGSGRGSSNGHHGRH